MTSTLSHWKRYPADAADWFPSDVVERGRAYGRPVHRMNAAQWILSAAVVLVFVAIDGPAEVLDAVGVSGWSLQLVVLVVALDLLALLYRPWFAAWRVFRHDRAWELSTQTPKGFVADMVKEFVLSIVITSAMLVPLYAVIRSTSWWWVWGWLIFTGFTVLFGFLFPIVFAPIFNKFTPLEDDVIAPRVRAVAERAGLRIQGVYVADASIRSRATNAYVAGLGRTRRVVLYDTILEWPPDLLEQVVAHELGHWKFKHMSRQLPLLALLQLVAFAALKVVVEAETVLDWIGAAELGDPVTFPFLFLLYPVLLGVAGLAMSWLSRAYERQADLHALAVLDDPHAFEATFRRLADDNKAEVDPPWFRRVRHSHPPVPERLAMADAWRRRGSAESTE